MRPDFVNKSFAKALNLIWKLSLTWLASPHLSSATPCLTWTAHQDPEEVVWEHSPFSTHIESEEEGMDTLLDPQAIPDSGIGFSVEAKDQLEAGMLGAYNTLRHWLSYSLVK